LEKFGDFKKTYPAAFTKSKVRDPLKTPSGLEHSVRGPLKAPTGLEHSVRAFN